MKKKVIITLLAIVLVPILLFVISQIYVLFITKSIADSAINNSSAVEEKLKELEELSNPANTDDIPTN